MQPHEIEPESPGRFDLAAIAAQQRVRELQGVSRTWFCGAWTRYGFHEDGLKAGLGVARQLLIEFERAAVMALDLEMTA